jgi:thiol:disulfide interchange protein DsbD
MKRLFALITLVLLGISVAYAQSPDAGVSVAPLNSDGWPAKYKLTLEVPVDHHAYLDAGVENAYIPVKLTLDTGPGGSGLTITNLQKPSGVNDPEVKATVLRGSNDFMLELMASQSPAPSPASNAQLKVVYQLCNELTHVCYRPKTAEVSLPLPAVSSLPAQEAQSLGFMEQLQQVFENNKGNTLIMFWLMFAAGLLSVATPCVYPMLPITSMFITGRAKGVAGKDKQHALAYLLGMIISYMVLGLLAGMTGGAFNTFMQSSLVNIGFAVFFAFFGLSLLGFYELSFMQNEVHTLDQHSAKVKGISGTLLMGCVAGLVISPCVGPIVFALLLGVADSIAEKADAMAQLNQAFGFWDKLAVAWQGSLMMGGFGLGVGLPFFAVGAVKFKKMPKAGLWMNKVKYAFGFMILYFAYTYLQKGLGVLGAEPQVGQVLAAGLVVLWFAVVQCQVLSLTSETHQPQEKMHRFLGVVSLLLGGWLIVSGLEHLPLLSKISPMPIASANAVASTTNVQPIEHEAGIPWYRNYEAAQKVAQQSGKPLFIDFYASWCANCLEFKKEAAQNEQLNKALRDKAVAVKLVDKEPEFEKFREDKNHRPLKIGLPYFAIILPNGKLAWSGTDYKAVHAMIAELDKWSQTGGI